MTYIVAIAILIGALWAAWKFSKEARRQRLRALPLDSVWQALLAGRVQVYASLPPSLREELHGHIQVLLHEKNFEGCGGLVLTDEMKVTIAAGAGLLLLNRRTDYYPKLTSILVYPSAYVVKDVMDEHGFVVNEEVRDGESWATGMVVLAWDEVERGLRGEADGHNVILHEFAHQLDREDGAVDGTPILADRSRYATWARILGKEFKALRRRSARRLETVIDQYGALNPGEFFATATETFFERPRQMLLHHPELYAEIKNYYRVDPATWKPEGEGGPQPPGFDGK